MAGDRAADRDNIAVTFHSEATNVSSSPISQPINDGSNDGYERRFYGAGLVHQCVSNCGAPGRHYSDASPGKWLHVACSHHIRRSTLPLTSV